MELQQAVQKNSICMIIRFENYIVLLYCSVYRPISIKANNVVSTIILFPPLFCSHKVFKLTTFKTAGSSRVFNGSVCGLEVQKVVLIAMTATCHHSCYSYKRACLHLALRYSLKSVVSLSLSNTILLYSYTLIYLKQ